MSTSGNHTGRVAYEAAITGLVMISVYILVRIFIIKAPFVPTKLSQYF